MLLEVFTIQNLINYYGSTKQKKNLCVPYSIKTYNLETNLSNLITKVKANIFKNLYKLFKKKMLKLLLIK